MEGFFLDVLSTPAAFRDKKDHDNIPAKCPGGLRNITGGVLLRILNWMSYFSPGYNAKDTLAEV